MTINQAIDQAAAWFRKAILLLLLVCIAAILIRQFGVTLPIRLPGHVELAYLAGAFWLTK